MRQLICTLIFAVCAGFAHAQDTALEQFSTGDDSRGWEAVGRLDIEGKGFCTATLIDETTVLTAAHCVFDRAGAVTADRLTFSAGLRNGRAEAYRDIRRIVVHPQYDPNRIERDVAVVAYDLALLELAQPIRNTRIEPIPVAASLLRGQAVGVVSYARDRADAPSIQETCSVLGRQEQVLVMTCDINFGSSGAPVFRLNGGRAEVVSVISAMSDLNGDPVSLGASLGAPLTELQAMITTTPRIQTNTLLPGQRSDTGAKFIRPGGG